MPPFQLIIRIKYGNEGEVDRRALTMGAVGLGERVCRVGWVGLVGVGDPYQIYVRVGWGQGMQDIRNSPLTLNLANLRLNETINLSSSSSEGGRWRWRRWRRRRRCEEEEEKDVFVIL